MNRIVYLARHGTHAEVGHALSGRSDISLNAAGRSEAAALADRLASVPIEAIYASPRPRAWETAQIVATARGMDVRIAPALDEIDFGDWTGRAFADLDGDPDWAAWNTRRGTAAVPGGETMAAAVDRARGFIEGLTYAIVLCVSHCDIIRGLVASYIGLDLDRLLTFDCDPASLTTLSFGPDGGRPVTLNERPSLPA